MPIADFIPSTATIPLGQNAAFTVRGLSLEDIGALLQDHQADFAVVAELLRGQTFDRTTLLAVAHQTIDLVPALAAAAIARAAGEPDQAPVVRRFTAPTTVVALLTVIKLTLDGRAVVELARDFGDIARGFMPSTAAALPLEG